MEIEGVHFEVKGGKNFRRGKKFFRGCKMR